MDLSKRRQKLKNLFDEQAALLPVFLKQTPLIKGGVYQTKTKCGKKECACEREGNLHCVWRWYRTENGKSINSVLREEEVVRYEEYFRNYQNFRKARAEFVKNHEKELDLIDALGKGLEKKIISEAQRQRRQRS